MHLQGMYVDAKVLQFTQSETRDLPSGRSHRIMHSYAAVQVILTCVISECQATLIVPNSFSQCCLGLMPTSTMLLRTQWRCDRIDNGRRSALTSSQRDLISVL